MYQFIKLFAEPYVAFIVLSTLLAWRSRRLYSTPSTRSLFRLMLLMWVASLPVTGWFLVNLLESPFRDVDVDATELDAIIVLGAGIHYDPETETSRLTVDAMARCVKAAEIARENDAVLIVSGAIPGSMPESPSEAAVMRDFLIEIGVPAERILIEDQARTTFENAVESVKMVRARDLTEVAVVTQGWHLTRSVACFRKQGLEVYPVGCLWLAGSLKAAWYQQVVPRSQYLYMTQRAIHEWLGIGWYAWKDRLSVSDIL